jgi:hypothetical protein
MFFFSVSWVNFGVPKQGGHTAVGTRHAHVCEVEDLDPTPVEQICWCQTVHVPNRPFGQKTNSL